jgi:hypothetical protein
MNPLTQLQEYRQAIWMDYIRRDPITSGELKRLVDEDGVRGLPPGPGFVASFDGTKRAMADSGNVRAVMSGTSGANDKVLYHSYQEPGREAVNFRKNQRFPPEGPCAGGVVLEAGFCSARRSKALQRCRAAIA